MLNKRLTRVNELLKREIADALYREMNETGFDLSAVSVTRVEVSSNLRNAKVFVSIRDASKAEHALRLLRRHRVSIQDRVNRDVVLKYTPVLNFELDQSIRQGDRVLELLSRMEPPASPDDGEPEPEPPAAPEPDAPGSDEL